MHLFLILAILNLPIGEVRVIPAVSNQQLIISASGLVPGMEYNDDASSAALRRLFALQRFDYLAIDTALVDSRVDVVIQVEQPPRLTHLEVVGNRKIKTNTLLKEITADSGATLTGRQIFEWERVIREKYEKKRYLLVDISTRLIETDQEGFSVARIEIEEGNDVYINSISFTGNDNISSSRLARLMKNRSRWFIIRSGRFDEQKFRMDIERIEAFYQDKGWIDAQVADTELPIDSLGQLDITIHLDEGRRYYTGINSFEGAEALPESTLINMVLLEENEPYSLGTAQLSTNRLHRAYWEEGYIYAVVEPVESLRGDTVDVTYRIREGDPATVRRVVIEGNYRVRDNAIRREIMLLPGSVFKYSQVERSQMNIFNMNLFEDVRFSPVELEDQPGVIDLVFTVVEKPTGQFGAGISYGGSETGLVGNVEMYHPNVFGGAEIGQLRLERGTQFGQALISLTEPWLFDRPVLLGGELYYRTQRYDLYDGRGTAYNHISLGGSVRTLWPLPLDYAKGGVTLRIEQINIDSVRGHHFPDEPILGFDPASYPKTTASLTFVLFRDSRDYYHNPSAGSYLYQSIEFAGAPLPDNIDFLGDVDFIKENLEMHVYFPLAWEKKVVLTQKMKLGYVTGYTSHDTIPIYERYRPGGVSTDGMVRGYDDLSLGTVVDGALLGGRAMTVFNTELKVKVTPQIALLGFFDAGAAWDNINQVNLSQLNKGVGLGIRFEVPFVGVLGFDAGWGLDYTYPSDSSFWYKFGQSFRPHFQITRNF